MTTADVALRVLSARDTLVGGADGNALQNLICDNLASGAICWVNDQDSPYYFVKDSMTAVSSPTVIATGRGASVPGRWFRFSGGGATGPTGPDGDFDPLTLTYYVDQGYSGGSSDGSIARPFLTIQAAVNAGAKTVLIVGGFTYAETVIPTPAMNFIGIPSNGITAPVVVNEIDLQAEGDSVYLEGLDTSVNVTGAIAVTIRGERCVLGAVEADAGTITLLDLQRCTVETIDAGTGSVVLEECQVSSTIDAGTFAANDCTLLDVFALEATFVDCRWLLESELTQSGATGGGAPHGNPSWRFIGCLWEAAPSLESQGGGQSFAVYWDEQSWGNFWASGGALTGVTSYQDSAVGQYQVYATDGTNTVDSSSSALYKAVTGVAFTTQTTNGQPWTKPAGPVITYTDVMSGALGAPQSPPCQALARVVASVVSAAGGLVGLAVSIDGDTVGEGLTDRSHSNALQQAPAGVITQIVSERTVNLPLAGNTTVQPVFASNSGDDLTIQTLTITVIPQTPLTGF